MNSSTELTLHTLQPQCLDYPHDTYRNVMGVVYDTTEVWLPNSPSKHVRPEVFDVPHALAAGICEYFDRYYVRPRPGLFRNCHLGAAVMLGAIGEDLSEGLVAAQAVMLEGEALDCDELPVGGHGVFGKFQNGEPDPYHSVIGIAPGLGLQTDSIQGAFSLVGHRDNLAYYRKRTYSARLTFYGRPAPGDARAGIGA